MQTVDTRSQAKAACLEHQILDHVKQALRVTIGWKVPAEGLARKLSSVQFTLKSFQRHLERLIEFEEQDGYMSLVLDTKPNLQCRVERLAREHEGLRATISYLVPEIEALKEFEHDRIEQLCGEIAEFLDRVDRHDQEEIELLQESLLVDEGGEG